MISDDVPALGFGPPMSGSVTSETMRLYRDLRLTRRPFRSGAETTAPPRLTPLGDSALGLI